MARNRAFGRIQEDQKKTSFFKILADKDLSSESMRLIPHEFVRRSEWKNLPLKVILKVVWGRSWTMNLSKFMGSYLMERKGWEKFLNDNQLGGDEFLTFTNEGNNCLTVDIFQKNCKEILRPRKTTFIASSSSSSVKKEKMSCVDPAIAESTRRGAKEKERAEEEEEWKKYKKMKKKADNNVDGASSSYSIATFSLTIKQSHLLLLARDICPFETIPKDFAKEHMPKQRTKFIIHDPKGKPWEVVYVNSDGSKLFSRGWRLLARDYGLAVGDFCTFRLIKPKEMVLEVLRASP